MRTPVYIYILNDNISKSNKDHIKSLVKDDNVHLEFIDTDILYNLDITLQAMEKDSRESLTSYAFLFMNSLLPEDVDKVICMDCDGVVLGSFKELWDMDLKDNYAAGVLDVIDEVFLEGFEFELDSYFNAGFLYINLKKWREDNIEDAILEFMKENQYKAYQHDQGIINNVLKDKIAVIDPKYNLIEYFNFLDYDLALKLTIRDSEYYSKEIVNEAFDNPVFMHFCGYPFTKPWFNELHPYRKEYFKYVKLAGFNNNKFFTNDPDLTIKGKLLYKAFNNTFFKLLLKLYPSSILYNQNKKLTLDKIEEDKKKASKLAKN